MFGDEIGGSEIKHETAIHLLVEVEVEVVERDLWIAELGFFSPALQQTIATTTQFIGHETRDQIDRGHPFGLSLMETCFQHGSNAAETKLFQGTLEFNRIHFFAPGF